MMSDQKIQEVMALVEEYWTLAYQEGKEGRTHDTPDGAAQRCLSAIERALREQVREVPEGWEPSDKPVTPARALYFMERFKREEKLLGPHEQAAVDFVIGLLSAAPTQPAQAEQPIKHAFKEWFGGEINAAPHCGHCGRLRNDPIHTVFQPKAAQQEPVMIYRGRCVIDCGEHGHHDVELLRMIPAGTLLYTAAAPQREPMTTYTVVGWLVSDSEGDDDFINNPAALNGRNYKGKAPMPVYVPERFHGITKKEQQ